jgi:hypothetical protein
MNKEGRVNLCLPVDLKRKIEADFKTNVQDLFNRDITTYNKMIVEILKEKYDYGV